MQTHHQHGNRFSGGIDRLRSPERLARLEVERVLDLSLAGCQIQAVIDIGTGSAVFAEAFARRGLKVAGIDVNPEMLEVARSYVPDADFHQAPAESLPFSNASFDLAFMGLVLHETDHLQQALHEARRVSRQRLVILEWPYEVQSFGPGLEERLPPAKVMEFAQKAGFSGGEEIRLQQLVLYRFLPTGVSA